ncbi:type II secretion system F family protein [bacterium]|nr:type II secretion system F family protein [bacterium]
METLVAVLVFALVAIILLAVGLTMKTERQIMLDRLRQYGRSSTSDAAMLSDNLMLPFWERVVRPMLTALGEIGAGMRLENAAHRLNAAGNPHAISPKEFVAIKRVCSVVGLALGIVLTRIGSMSILSTVAAALLGLALGAYVPEKWVTSKIAERKNDILKALPNTIDLLSVSIEAGLGLDGAIARIAEKTKGPLSEEFSLALKEMQVGMSKMDALRNMATRAQVPELSNFVAAVYQAEELGASLTDVIRIQGQVIRSRRRMRAREAAARLPVTMLFPLVFFIFPSIFIVVLAPGMIRMMHSAFFK